MIVIEKEATFRYLVSVGFCQSLPESCVLVTVRLYAAKKKKRNKCTQK